MPRLLSLWRLLSLAALPLAVGVRAADSPPRADRPDPREIPVPAVATAFPPQPGVDALPAQPGLPDVLTLADGTPVRTPDEWRRRRTEMRRILEHYAVGHAPPPPGRVQVAEVHTESIAAGATAVRYRLLHLTFGPDDALSLDVGLFTPAAEGPVPVIIYPSGTPPGATPQPRLPPGPNQGRGEDVLLLVGPPPADPPLVRPPAPPAVATVAAQHEQVFRRGYALAVFNPNDCAEDTTLRNADGSWAFRNTRFFPAYPGYDWGIIAAWTWGASRVADALVADAAIDRGGLIVTGVSRLGKAALVAAAFDERLLGAPVVTGGGGLGAYRACGPRGSETLDIMQRKYPNWFSPHLHEFWGQPAKLPFDQHWFLALCAPRPFLALEGLTDRISLPAAVQASFAGAAPAYARFAATDRLGVHYGPHGHAFTTGDWTALLDFFDHHLRGRPLPAGFDRFPTEAELDAALAAAK